MVGDVRRVPSAQPGDPTRNAHNAASLCGLSGVTKHVQLGFSLLPLLLPHESGSRGVILQRDVGGKNFCFFNAAVPFLFYDAFCRRCGNDDPPP